MFRRSVATAGDAGEHALLARARTTCTACNGLPSGQSETGGSDD